MVRASSNLAEQMDREFRDAETRVAQNLLPVQKATSDFARFAVGDIYDGKKRQTAPWVVDRNAYVDVYKGAVYIAIGAIARNVAMQDVKVLRRVKKKSGSRLEPVGHEHPLSELFHNVNPFDTEYDLFFYLIGWRLLTGDSFLWKTRNSFDTPVELWPMPSQWVHVVPDPREFIKAYQVDSMFGMPEVLIPSRDMIHIREPNLDWRNSGRFYGSPPVKAAATSIDLENEMFSRLYHQFKNFAHPGMVFSTDRMLHEHQVRQIYGQIGGQHSAAEHTGRPMIVHSGLKLQGQFSQGVKELDFQNSLMSTLEYTLAIFGVPPAVVGIVDQQSRANSLAALTAFATHTINPLCKHISQHFTQDLAVDFEDDLEVQIGPMEVNDMDSIIDAFETAWRTGAVTPNDAREILLKKGQFKYGGDRPTLNAGMVEAPFGDEKPPEPPPMPMPGAPGVPVNVATPEENDPGDHEGDEESDFTPDVGELIQQRRHTRRARRNGDVKKKRRSNGRAQ